MNHTDINPPMKIKAAGHNTLFGTAQSILQVLVCNTLDVYRTFKLSIVLVRGSRSNIFPTAVTGQNNVKTIVTSARSIVYLGLFSIQLTRSDKFGRLVFAIAKESKRTESESCAIPGKTFGNETVLTASVPRNPVALPAESINLV